MRFNPTFFMPRQLVSRLINELIDGRKGFRSNLFPKRKRIFVHRCSYSQSYLTHLLRWFPNATSSFSGNQFSTWRQTSPGLSLGIGSMDLKSSQENSVMKKYFAIHSHHEHTFWQLKAVAWSDGTKIIWKSITSVNFCRVHFSPSSACSHVHLTL